MDPASVTAAETADDQVARKFLDGNRELWTRTVPLREVLKDIEGGVFEGIFFVGGHGRAYPFAPIYMWMDANTDLIQQPCTTSPPTQPPSPSSNP